MQRSAFILLLALLAIIQCGATVESSSSRLLRKTSRPTKKLDFSSSITYSQQQQTQNHRELSSSSSGGTWFARLWYNALTHLCPPHHEHCPHPCPPGKPDCHHHSSSSGGESSGGGSTAGSSGGDSSSGGSSEGSSSYSNNGDGEYSNNDGWSADGHDGGNYSGDVDYTNGDGSTTWSDDAWNSSNLDNGNANGATFEVNAQSIVPFLVGALVAGVIGAAFVVSRNRRKAEEEAHPLEGSLKKRMKLFSGGVFRKKRGMLDDEVGEDGDARSPAFVEIASVGDARSVRSGAGIYEAPNVSNVVSGFDNEDDSDLDSEM